MTTTPKQLPQNPPGFRTPSDVLREEAEAAAAKKARLLRIYPSHEYGSHNTAYRGPVKKG
jgi:hypothetical protein